MAQRSRRRKVSWKRAGSVEPGPPWDMWPCGAGWIYAVQEGVTPLIKIGCTTYPLAHRLRQLEYQFHIQCSVVGAVSVPDKLFTVEKRIHRLLAAEHIEGEWFYLHMDQKLLASLVQQVCLRLSQEDCSWALGYAGLPGRDVWRRQ
jgi:hypothetical protein